MNLPHKFDGWVLDPSAERLEGAGVIDMAYPIVQDRTPPEAVLEALRGAASLVHRYPHREREVREALARYLEIHPARVLPTAGANGALDLVSRVFLAGRRVVVPVPAFWQLVEAPRRYGAEVVCPDLLAPHGEERIVEAFEHADAVILCSPHNPLGQPVDPALLSRLLEISRGRPVIVDESYADMGGFSAARAGAWPDLVLIRGFKTFLSDNESQCDKFKGFAHGGPGNAVNICYYSYTTAHDLCDLARTIMHEQGHAHGFRMVPGHNDPTDYHYEHDPIYRMGSIAGEFCEASASAGLFANDNLRGGGDRSIGANCKEDLQCRSSRCSGGECVCNEDSDCPSGQRCFKPVAAKNFCSSTSRELGESCNREDECRSNQCEGGVCVCRHDSDCPSGQVCKTPITGKNSCEASDDVGAKALSAVCDRNSECLSNKCESKECVCNSDSDCPSGQECYRPITGTNDCRPVSLALGRSCQRDSQCRSNKCEQDECVCRTNDDCPSGQVCKTPITGKNRCED